LSELLKWFEKRRESKAIALMQRHLATTMSSVEDLERAVKAAVDLNEKEAKAAIGRVTSSEKEADGLRRAVMTELACGELPPSDREYLMNLVKCVDMVADWSRESSRVLSAIPMEDVPENLKKALVKMVESAKECAMALRKCINSIPEKREEALKAADEVERLEEKVDDLFEDSRRLIAREEKIRVGTAILLNDLFEAIEMVADRCEDACDQVRVIVVCR
jgi:predicted phosphate transport protein (TIGR00153 family)